MADNIDISQDPYLDDFDPTKNYIQLLAVPGRAEQAREFTQTQSIMLYLMRKLASTILKEGTIISGMSFTINGSTITVLQGQIYLEGIVHDFPEANIDITGSGVENIGITLQKSIVTEVEDITLRDQAQGFENFGLPGAHRLKVVPILTLNDPASPTLYKFIDGVLQSDPIRGDAASDLLARRTYDESGNYRVNGLTLWCESKDSNSIFLNVDSGKAYVMGYEVIKPASVKIVVPMSKGTRTVLNEPKVYSSGTSAYVLNNNPVANVSRVSATVETSATITRGGSIGGMDLLNKSPVVSIVSVIQGGTTYVEGTDYQLSGDSIDWSLGGAEPSGGSSYDVVWRYNKVMVEETDYIVTNATVNGKIVYSIDFSPSGDNPVDTTQILIDYDFYLSRKDLVSINRFGEIIITTGQSNIPSLVNTPVNTNPDLLHLGTVYLGPNETVGIPNSYAITRLRMEDLQRVSRRVEDIEYNQALAGLDDEAMAGENPTSLKGIFSEGFIGVTKADITHPSFTAAFSLEEGAMVAPPTTVKLSTPTMNVASSSAKKWSKLVTAPSTEVLGASQSYTTGTMSVNPFGYGRKSLLRITPNSDNWVDNSSMSVQKTNIATTNVQRWWYNGGDLWSETEQYLFNTLNSDIAKQGWNDGSTTSSSTARTILDNAIQFIRPRSISIEALNLAPNTDNLECYFDGQKVILTPTGSTSAGTSSGTVKSDANGQVTASFTIPSGIRTGVRVVELKNATNSAKTIYSATGRTREVEDRVFVNRTESTPYGPLAQSFRFTRDQMVSSVGLYFKSKNSSSGVVVQIRNMAAGVPGPVVLAETFITPANVLISDTGTLETRVYFSDPAYCKANTQYCIVITTDSADYTIHAAELGKFDLEDTSVYVSRQPFVDGSLFTSSNELTWTTQQNKDLKFNIYTCVFNANSEIVFSSIGSLGVDRLMLFSEYITPQGTGCTWEVKIDSGSYEPLENYKDRSLSSVATTVELKAKFTATQNASPVLSLDCLTLAGFISDTSAVYIGKNATLAQSYTVVKQVFDAHIPAGCTVVPKFASDTTGTSWTTGSLQSTQDIDGYYSRYTYQYTLGAGETNFRARLDITGSSATDRPKARRFINIMK